MQYIIGVRKVFGKYGRLMQVDDEGNEIEVKVEKVKRGRGRPKSFATSCQMSYNPMLDKIIRKWVEAKENDH